MLCSEEYASYIVSEFSFEAGVVPFAAVSFPVLGVVEVVSHFFSVPAFSASFSYRDDAVYSLCSEVFVYPVGVVSFVHAVRVCKDRALFGEVDNVLGVSTPFGSESEGEYSVAGRVQAEFQRLLDRVCPVYAFEVVLAGIRPAQPCSVNCAIRSSLDAGCQGNKEVLEPERKPFHKLF